MGLAAIGNMIAMLVTFVNPLSIVLNWGILLATAGWYLYYARTVTRSEIAS